MAFKIKILRVLALLSILSTGTIAFAQGDFAPYEKPELIKKITDKTDKDTSATPTEKSKAAEKAKSKRKDAGQLAKIKVDGSAVYEVPNFDAPVIEYMDRGKKVKISKKIYPGIGGLGAFYKIRVKKGVYGYIADIDAEILSKKYVDKDKSDDIEDDEDDEKLEESPDPTVLNDDMYSSDEPDPSSGTFYLTRYIGLNYSTFNYAEVLRNRTDTAQTTLLGAKISGPTRYMGGMPLDINVLLTTSAPDFYSDIASSTSGFMLISDGLVSMPLYETKNFLLTYGFGLVVRYSSWKVKLKQQPGKKAVASEEVAVGAAAGAGVAYRFSQRIAARLDAKYYYEEEKYFGYGAALQFKY